MKVVAFARRNAKEILRDPLSYIFCLGFPVVMLIIMTIVNESIPKEAAMDIFAMKKLAPAIVVFGFTFIMLFTAILLTKDREGNFLNRIRCAPVRPWELMAGYVLPVILIGIGQVLITYVAAWIISMLSGSEVSIGGMIFSVVALMPAMLIFVAIGVILGALFSERAAPGLGSVLITVASMLGGIWMDIEAVGGTLLTVAKALPFYWCCRVGRAAVELDYGEVLHSGMVPLIYCIGLWVVAALTLGRAVGKE